MKSKIKAFLLVSMSFPFQVFPSVPGYIEHAAELSFDVTKKCCFELLGFSFNRVIQRLFHQKGWKAFVAPNTRRLSSVPIRPAFYQIRL